MQILCRTQGREEIIVSSQEISNSLGEYWVETAMTIETGLTRLMIKLSLKDAGDLGAALQAMANRGEERLALKRRTKP